LIEIQELRKGMGDEKRFELKDKEDQSSKERWRALKSVEER